MHTGDDSSGMVGSRMPKFSNQARSALALIDLARAVRMDETCCCCLVVVSLASALVERRAGREGVREMCPGAAALVVFELEIIVFILVFGRA